MEINPESGGFKREKKKSGLAEVKNFCANWDRGHIISLPDGNYLVERLDEKGSQDGIYGFNKAGELIEYSMSTGPSLLDEFIDDLDRNGIQAEVIEINKKNEQPHVAE